MTLTQVRETYSWQAAIALGPTLMSLADELPSAEDMGLGYQLRLLAVELPAWIAADLLNGRSARLLDVLKLSTAMELIDRVYPALDTADAKAAVDELTQRLAGPDFAQTVGGAKAAPPVLRLKPVAAAEPAPRAEPTPRSEEPSEPEVKPAPVQPTTVAVTAEPAAPANEHSDTSPHEAEETDVHPDSVQ